MIKVETGQLRCWKSRDYGVGESGCFIVFEPEGNFVAPHGRTMEYYWSIIVDDKLLSGWPNSIIEHASEVISESR